MNLSQPCAYTHQYLTARWLRSRKIGEYQSATLTHSSMSHRALAQEPAEQGGQRPQQLLLHPSPLTVGHHGAVAHGGAALPLHSAPPTMSAWIET
eukprot:COSAG01_NODE_363_length_18113_cov_45.041690_4_plen_95_part_00